MIKVLNLYAGIGGNRKLWKDVEVTSVEIDKDIAKIYQHFFPNDTVIVGDAHKYLLEHYDRFDFVWASPPCPSHSRVRILSCKSGIGGKGQEPHKPVFPDMKLYEEILFLKGYCKSKWCVENVISWYEPLIKPYNYNAHYYWSNFYIDNSNKNTNRAHNDGNKALAELKGFDLTMFKNIDKRKILRNCVEPKAGKYVFDCAFKIKQKTLNY